MLFPSNVSLNDWSRKKWQKEYKWSTYDRLNNHLQHILCSDGDSLASYTELFPIPNFSRKESGRSEPLWKPAAQDRMTWGGKISERTFERNCKPSCSVFRNPPVSINNINLRQRWNSNDSQSESMKSITSWSFLILTIFLILSYLNWKEHMVVW